MSLDGGMGLRKVGFRTKTGGFRNGNESNENLDGMSRWNAPLGLRHVSRASGRDTRAAPPAPRRSGRRAVSRSPSSDRNRASRSTAGAGATHSFFSALAGVREPPA